MGKQAVDADTLRGVIAMFGTAATVATVGASDASFDTGELPATSSRSGAYRYHHVARNLRRLVKDVLLPLHRSSALSTVTIARR